jgi:hypothetical protein
VTDSRVERRLAAGLAVDVAYRVRRATRDQSVYVRLAKGLLLAALPRPQEPTLSLRHCLRMAA